MSAYIDKLKQQASQPSAPQPSTLEKKFETWWASLPQSTRVRPYSMQELEVALHAQGRHIGIMLAARGWTRKRRWQGTMHYWRFWVPED